MNTTLATDQMGSIVPDDADTLIDEVLDLDHEEVLPKQAEIASFLAHVASRSSETFVGFEVPLAEMWRATPVDIKGM